jgi:hypothetical protein
MRPTSLLTPLVAVAVLVTASASLADCPPSTFLYGAIDPSIPIVKVAPRCDTVFSIQTCDRVHGRYDVPAGLVIASIDVACPSEAFLPPSGLETAWEDDFQLVGLAPGTPASFNAVLHLRGEAHVFSAPPPIGAGGARLHGLLTEGASNSVSLFRSTTSLERDIFVNEPLTLSINAVAGTPVHLRIAVRAEALDARGEMEGLLEFTGLAPGVTLTSCRGYVSDAPVAARRSSWGRLKAVYR